MAIKDSKIFILTVLIISCLAVIYVVPFTDAINAQSLPDMIDMDTIEVGTILLTYSEPLQIMYTPSPYQLDVVDSEQRTVDTIRLTFPDGKTADLPADAIVSLAKPPAQETIGLKPITEADNETWNMIASTGGWLTIADVARISCPRATYRKPVMNTVTSTATLPRMIAIDRILVVADSAGGFVWSDSSTQINRLLDFPASGKINIDGAFGNHDYLCYTDQITYEIAECCGGDTCNFMAQAGGGADSWGGVRKNTGNSINSSGIIYYCRDDGSFSQDLDDLSLYPETSSGEACRSAKYPDGTSQGLKWTGALCCGEMDDPSEFYNDPEGNGACWNSTYMKNNDFIYINGLKKPEMISFEGQILGCNISETKYIAGNEHFLDMTDSHLCGQLVTDIPMCELKISEEDTGSNFICTSYGVWEETQATEMFTKSAAWEVESMGGTQSSCCAGDQCWDGFECQPDQWNDKSLTTYPLLKDEDEPSYRCINGDWTEAVFKTNYNNEEVGFCPHQTQCLVTMAEEAVPANNNQSEKFYSNDERPMCVTTGDYFLDYYCDGGNWTTRTKDIATALIQKAGSGAYTIYCGDYDKVLPDYQGKITVACERNGFDTECFNNICVLSYGDEVLVGTSYNVPLDSSMIANDPIISDCAGKTLGGTGFVACNPTQGGSSAYFNTRTESIIFDKYKLDSLGQAGFLQFTSLIRDKVMAMLGYIKNTMDPTRDTFGSEEPIDVTLIDHEQYFNEIYMAKSGAKEVIAIKGKVADVPDEPIDRQDIETYDYIAVEFNGFSGMDVCDYIDAYMNKFYIEHADDADDGRSFESMSCAVQGNTYYIFTKDRVGDDVWADLTARIRI